MNRARRREFPQRRRRRDLGGQILQQQRQTVDVIVGRRRWRERVANDWFFVGVTGARANKRAGRTIGVARDGKLVLAVRSFVFVSGDVAAQSADVPGRSDGGEQRQRDGNPLQSARPLREPGAHRQKNHVYKEYQ